MSDTDELREKLRGLYDNAMSRYRATGAHYWDGASDAFADALAALDDLATCASAGSRPETAAFSRSRSLS